MEWVYRLEALIFGTSEEGDHVSGYKKFWRNMLWIVIFHTCSRLGALQVIRQLPTMTSFQ
jgi:hypothetical protein